MDLPATAALEAVQSPHPSTPEPSNNFPELRIRAAFPGTDFYDKERRGVLLENLTIGTRAEFVGEGLETACADYARLGDSDPTAGDCLEEEMFSAARYYKEFALRMESNAAHFAMIRMEHKSR